MAVVDATVLLDFVSSLAVLGLLVLSFSALAPALRSGWYVAPTLGAFFALVVGLQMSMTLSPADGVIVDMRQVPIVLAGAFLGFRGLAVCLCIAVSMRLAIGGIGMPAGVLGMLLAGVSGYVWGSLRHRLPLNDVGKLGVLGLITNLHMLSAFVAPSDIMHWYFTAAAPTVFFLNMCSVPTIGWLLLREVNLVERTAFLSASARLDPVTRLLPTPAFAQEVAHFHASQDDHRLGGVIAVTLKTSSWLRRTWGDQSVAQALGVLRLRFGATVGDQRPLGIDSRDRILIPVTETEMRDLRPLRRTLRRCASETPLVIDDSIEVPLAVLMESFALRHPHAPDETAKDIQRATAARTPAAKRRTTRKKTRQPNDASMPKGLCRTTYQRLFDETDAHMRRAVKQG
ncbi:LytS/YhcK type 5TM receptor domain-containing protein [Tateyamaria sp. syn59]|uniref:LytS/YhcK type 5TM receptor domain-containing protein n=1 Tax=Tateyamaria sp. syn59 TaxID=2576942 RepID=UPI0011BE6C94|nr:LytS/YhcK type 5TM receptor domain-containing protein [Tateyamaria sp. syn59]